MLAISQGQPTRANRDVQRQIPTPGERNTQKIFGAVRLDNASFIYLHQQDYFQWETYLSFPGAGSGAHFLPLPPDLSDSGQRVVSQDAGNL